MFGHLFDRYPGKWREIKDANDEALIVAMTTSLKGDRVVLMKPSKGTNANCLTREQVAALIPLLQHFVDTGELPK